MKEDANMKKNIIAMALLIVMLFALTACGQSAAPAATEAPAAEAPASEAPAAEAAPSEEAAPAEEAAPTEEPAPVEEAPAVNVNAIPDGSGVVEKKSESKGFSIKFDSDKYTAFENFGGGIDVFAAENDGPPCCYISLFSKEDAGDALTYLKETAAAAEETLKLETKPGEPKKQELNGRDIYYIYFTYKSEDLGGVVASAIWAENLENGSIAVFNSLALQEETADVDAILNLAVQSFQLAE